MADRMLCTCYILSMNSTRAVGVLIVVVALGSALAQSPSPATKSTRGAASKTVVLQQTSATAPVEPKAEVPTTPHFRFRRHFVG